MIYVNKTNMKKSYWAIAILAAIAAAAVGIYYINQPALDLGLVSAHHQRIQTLSPTADTSGTSSPVYVEGWKTYISSQYGFEIQIPSDWNIKTDDNRLSFISKKTQTLTDSCVNFGGNCPDVINSDVEFDYNFDPNQFRQVTENVKKVFLGGYEWSRSVGNTDLYAAIGYKLIHNNQVYNFEIYSPNGIDENILKQILSTFKFTQQQADTSGATSPSSIEGWRTYTNSQYGFSFEYPSTWSYKDPWFINALGQQEFNVEIYLTNSDWTLINAITDSEKGSRTGVVQNIDFQKIADTNNLLAYKSRWNIANTRTGDSISVIRADFESKNQQPSGNLVQVINFESVENFNDFETFNKIVSTFKFTN